MIPEPQPMWRISDAVIAVLAGLGAAILVGSVLGTTDPSTLQVFGLIGTSPTVIARIESAAKVNFGLWDTVTTFPAVTSAPVTHQQSANPHNRFVRAVVEFSSATPTDHAMTFQMIGVARESG